MGYLYSSYGNKAFILSLLFLLVFEISIRAIFIDSFVINHGERLTLQIEKKTCLLLQLL